MIKLLEKSDDFSEEIKEYTIMSVPTLLVFKDGKLVKKESGFKNSTELDNLLK